MLETSDYLPGMLTTLASDADITLEVERFIALNAIPVTTFGRRAVGDANLVANLRAGRELRRSTEAKVRAFMATYIADTRAHAA